MRSRNPFLQLSGLHGYQGKPQSHGPEVLSDKALALASVLFFSSCYLASYRPGKERERLQQQLRTLSTAKGRNAHRMLSTFPFIDIYPRGVMPYVFHMKL